MFSNKARIVWRMALFGLLGLLMEVFYGAACSLAAGRADLRGSTSLWMFPLYALSGLLLAPAARRLKRRGLPLPARAAFYMLGIYAVEIAAGAGFDAFGLRIWDYSRLPYNIRGYVTLTYAPFWYGLGLVLESVYLTVDRVAFQLAARPDATQKEHEGSFVSGIDPE